MVGRAYTHLRAPHQVRRPPEGLRRRDRPRSDPRLPRPKGPRPLRPGSRRAKTTRVAFSADGVKQPREPLHRTRAPSARPPSPWTIRLTAEIGFEQALTAERVSSETIRTIPNPLGVLSKRAKHWLTNPDPAYAREEAPAAV